MACVSRVIHWEGKMPSASKPSGGRNGKLPVFSLVVMLILSTWSAALPARQAGRATEAQLQSIRKYIKQSWHTLMRSNAKLADAAVDPKFKAEAGSRWPVYVS